MRVHILALAAFSVTGLAHASSVEAIKTGVQTTRSIELIHCAKCIQEEAKKKVEPVAIELAPGTEKVEIRTVDGVTKIYRTEAWLGGSPVVFVSKAPESMIAKQVTDTPTENVAAKVDEKPAEQPVAIGPDMIDESATTSAVTADMGATIKVEPAKAAFDPNKLEMRLD